MRSVWWFAVAVMMFAGGSCSSSGPTAFTPVSERFSTAGTSGGMPDYAGTLTVRLADYAQSCPFTALDGGNFIFVTVNPTDGGTLTPGTFAVGTCASSAACFEQGSFVATSGTITLTSLSVQTVAGSYDVKVPLDDGGSSNTQELSGGFNASFCND